MVHHICLLQTKPDVSPEDLEQIMVETRIRLLKIPEITNLRVGKRIKVPENPYTYFYSFDVESMDKLQVTRDSAVWTLYEKQVLIPKVERMTSLEYEMEPGKDVTYS